ncbi:MAG: hypothetical protein L3J25_10465 [Flavobacteriaceae bacterium]|nr:hypothetical protein [Flavobacteriaceae bacterium]
MSCNDDLETNKEGQSISFDSGIAMRIGENDKPDFHTKIVLGEQLKNPYSVANMKNAFSYYNEKVSNSPFKKKKVKVTHFYIKITPTTENHLIALDNLDNSDDVDSPILHDYPLDYDIIEEGDYYIEPKDENDLYYPSYTVIPVGYKLPNNLPFENIEDLYYPEDEKEYDIETVALFFADWKDDLEADDIFVTEETLPEYLKKSLEEQNANRLFGRRYRPYGYVNIENTDSNDFDPLMKAKISIGRSFWWRYTYTDDAGYFRSPKKYRGKVRIRAKWRGYTATIRKTWNEILGFWVSDHLMTLKRRSNGRTKNISYTEPHNGIFGVDLRGGHLWFKGTTHNGLRKYNDYAAINGIDKPISYANVWAWSGGKSSSTPMLHEFPMLPQMASIAGIGQSDFWHASIQYVTSAGIGLVPHWIRPDQIFANLKNKKVSGSTQSNTVRIHQLVFHESGHYSHAKKAGSWFWANVFATEMSNSILEGDPYVDGSSPSFQAGSRISLAEGWGNFTEFKITSYHYRKAYMSSINGTGFFNDTASGNNISIERNMENFNIYDKPMNDDRFDDYSWFLHGIMWDLLDSNTENFIGNTGLTFSRRRDGDGLSLNNIVDNIAIGTSNEYDLSFVFNSLGSTVHSACDLRNDINIAVPGLDFAINPLFTSYGYNCK